MRLKSLPTIAAAAALSALIACKSSSTNKSYPETTDGLKAMFSDIADAGEGDAQKIADRLKPSDAKALYEKYFDKALAGELAREAEAQFAKFGTLAKAIHAQKKRGRTEISVEAFSEVGDEAMTGLQNKALSMMKNKTKLYSLRMTEPGKDSGFHLWSFVYVDGQFQMVGKMRAVLGGAKPSPLDELRIRSAKEILSGK